MSRSDKILKIVLITKNEKYLLKHWITYHGEIFGYENLHIIDDSNDAEVLNYYDSIKTLPINIYRENNNLNSLSDFMNKVFNEIKNDCDFIIKLDTDEFICYYDKESNDIIIDKKIILENLNSLTINGNKYKCSYSANSFPTEFKLNPLEYTTFSNPFYTHFKTFFYAKTFESIDLGSHGGAVIAPFDSNANNDTNFIIVHYHNQSFEQFIDNCKKAIISHDYIKESDTLDVALNKLKNNSFGLSVHKAAYYLRYLEDPNYKNSYYDRFINDPNKYIFDKLYKKLLHR